jgi:hypothetical protein
VKKHERKRQIIRIHMRRKSNSEEELENLFPSHPPPQHHLEFPPPSPATPLSSYLPVLDYFD